MSKKLSILFVSICLSIAACGQKSSSSVDSSASSEVTASPVSDGRIDVVLSSLQPTDNQGLYCDMFAEVTNLTPYNFTSLGINYVLRDANGLVLKKMVFRDRVAPNKTVAMSSTVANCSDVRSIEFPGLDTTEIDGDYAKDKLLASISIKSSSKVPQVEIK